MKSDEHWKYAQRISSVFCLVFGLILLITVILVKNMLEMEDYYVTMINTSISLFVYISGTIFIANKVKKYDTKITNTDKGDM